MSIRHIPQFPPSFSWSSIPTDLADYPYFPPRPASDDDGHSSSFLNTRSLSSSPGSGKDWPITPSTSNGHELFHHSSPRSASSSVSPVPRPSTNVVKVEPSDEPSDGCFIMENPTFDKDPPKVASFVSSQALAPPTEVPLRATQAPKKMKGMMGVFRINPFAMHNGSEGKGTAPTVCWEPGPLEEEPVMFEFQLDLIGYGSEDDADPSEKETLAAFDETHPFGEGPPEESSLDDRNIDPALKMSTLHAFSPEFDPQDEFSTATGHSSERYRSTPSAIHHQVALPEDQIQASCNTNPALLPQGDHRGSPFALEYHHNIQRPPSAASSSCTYGQWEFTNAEQQHHHHHQQQRHEVVGLDSSTSSVDRCGIQIHQDPVRGYSQGGSGGEEVHHHHYRGRGPYQHYHQHRPTAQTSEASRDSVVVPTASTSCSYGTLMVTAQTVHQQSGYTALQVDPEGYQHPSHNVEVAGGPTSSLGLYSIPSAAPAGDYASDTESLNHNHTSGGHYDTAGMINSAHISTATTTAAGADDVSSGLRFSGRGSNPHHPAVQYEYHHPYLRAIHSNNHKLLGRYHQVSAGGCGYSNGYSDEDGGSTSGYIYHEQTQNQSLIQSPHCPSPDLHTANATTSVDTALGPGRFWSRSYTALPVLSAARAS